MADQMMTITIAGMDDVMEAFSNMDETIVSRVVRRAMKNGTEIFKWAMKRNAGKSRDTGELQRSIAATIRTYSASNIVFGVVGPFHNIGQMHGHLVEFGHRIVSGGTVNRVRTSRTKGRLRKTAAKSRRGVRGGGSLLGQVPPQPYARPAEDAHKAAVARIMELELITGTQRELNRILAAG